MLGTSFFIYLFIYLFFIVDAISCNLDCVLHISHELSWTSKHSNLIYVFPTYYNTKKKMSFCYLFISKLHI